MHVLIFSFSYTYIYIHIHMHAHNACIYSIYVFKYISETYDMEKKTMYYTVDTGYTKVEESKI